MSEGTGQPAPGDPETTVEMPRPTAAPMILAAGIVLLAAGLVMGLAFLVVGGVILAIGLGTWIAHLLPGRGHIHEALAEPGQRPRPVTALPGTVERLRTGMPGYRMRLPEKIHPISAGFRGGIAGGVVMILPALVYGLLSGHGIWYPVNLLAGIALSVPRDLSAAELERYLENFHGSLLVIGLVIHVVLSTIIGLIFGVLLPTLPALHRYLSWGGLLMPLLWTAVTFGVMGLVNPLLARGVDWPWFIFSQFFFGMVAAAVLIEAKSLHPVTAGLLGGVAGGLVMPVPAILWSLASGHGLWYPSNLLAGMVIPGIGRLPMQELIQFHGYWLAVALVIHTVMSLGIGLVNGLLLPRLAVIPGPLAWGGLVLPLLWTGVSYGLMGVVNPLLQQQVNWPWFIVSQFVFGMTASFVVLRSATVAVPPAGTG